MSLDAARCLPIAAGLSDIGYLIEGLRGALNGARPRFTNNPA